MMEFDSGSTLNNMDISTPQSVKSVLNICVTDHPTKEDHQQKLIKSENLPYAPLKFLNSSAALKQSLFDEVNQEEYFYDFSVSQQTLLGNFEYQSYILIPIQSDVASWMQLNSYDVFPAIFEQGSNEYILTAYLYSQ